MLCTHLLQELDSGCPQPWSIAAEGFYQVDIIVGNSGRDIQALAGNNDHLGRILSLLGTELSQTWHREANQWTIWDVGSQVDNIYMYI